MRKLSDRFDSSTTTNASGVTLTSVVPMENDKGDGSGGGGWRNRVIDTSEWKKEDVLGVSRLDLLSYLFFCLGWESICKFYDFSSVGHCGYMINHLIPKM